MGVRIRDWAVAVSLAAVLGVLFGGVYSGVTGWQGPTRHVTAGSKATGPGSAGAGLPAPIERPTTAAAPGSPTATVGTAQVRTVLRPSRDKSAKDKPRKARDRDGEESGKRKDEHREKSRDHDGHGSGSGDG